MSATSPPSSHDTAFLAAASLTLDMLQLPELAARWTQASALPEMSVGALACHLGRQVTMTPELLTTETDLEPLDSVDEHYRRADWVRASSLDDPANDRTRDDDEAGLGPAALIDRVSAALDSTSLLLAEGTVEDLIGVSWQGWALHRDDYLLTRMLEIVVHTEDLAVSLELRSPEFEEQVINPVVELLVRLAVQRQGQSAVVSTLSRRERPQPIWAF